MTYEQFINNILMSRGRFNTCGYKERHHIVPKCMGGTNTQNNLIDLYAREHFIAHKLLVDENPDNQKLKAALWCMVNGKNKKYSSVDLCTPQEYEFARITYVNSLVGKKLSEETKRKISKAKKGKKGTPHSEETKKKLSEIAKNRPPISEETRRKISEKNRGENNGMYGKHVSEEAKKKLSESHKKENLSKETLQKMSDAKKGKKCLESQKKKMSEKMRGENNPMYGKHHTDASKEKMSNALMGKYCGEKSPRYGKHHTEETKNKISNAKIGKPNPKIAGKNNGMYGKPSINRKAVYCIELNITFESLKHAAEFLGLASGQSVSNCLCGKAKSAGKHPVTEKPLHWKWSNGGDVNGR